MMFGSIERTAQFLYNQLCFQKLYIETDNEQQQKCSIVRSTSRTCLPWLLSSSQDRQNAFYHTKMYSNYSSLYWYSYEILKKSKNFSLKMVESNKSHLIISAISNVIFNSLIFIPLRWLPVTFYHLVAIFTVKQQNATWRKRSFSRNQWLACNNYMTNLLNNTLGTLKIHFIR